MKFSVNERTRGFSEINYEFIFLVQVLFELDAVKNVCRESTVQKKDHFSGYRQNAATAHLVEVGVFMHYSSYFTRQEVAQREAK